MSITLIFSSGMQTPSRFTAFALGFAAMLAAAPAGAADFYAGKSIDLLIGAAPAGGYDIYGRVVARHLSRHIPGQPTIVVKNMPGAGSARAAGFISTVAPKDGTVDRRHHAGRHHGAVARSEGRYAVRSDQGALPRHRQQRHPRLRHQPGLEDQDLRRCAHPEGRVRRRVIQRFDPRLRLHAQENLRREIRSRHRLSRHRRHRAGDGARRDRRRLRLGLVELQVAAARLDPRPQGQRHPAGRARAERGTHPYGRALRSGNT